MDETFRHILLVGVGGFLGAVGRFLMTTWIHSRSDAFPYGTLVVNVLGCLVIGFLTTFIGERAFGSNTLRLVIMVGFLGAFTTFSAFSYESALLWTNGRWLALFSNVALNVGSCFLATGAGIAAAQIFRSA